MSPSGSVSLVRMAVESEQFKDSKIDKQNLLTLQSLPAIRNKLASIYKQDRFKETPEDAELNMIMGKVNTKFKSRNKSVFNYNTDLQRPFSIADSEIQRQSEFGHMLHIPSKISLADSFTPVQSIIKKKTNRSPHPIQINSSVAFLPSVQTAQRVVVNDYHVQMPQYS